LFTTPGTYQGTVNISTPPIGWQVISIDLVQEGEEVATESISWLFAGPGDINGDLEKGHILRPLGVDVLEVADTIFRI